MTDKHETFMHSFSSFFLAVMGTIFVVVVKKKSCGLEQKNISLCEDFLKIF